jgi:chromosome segregation ATPase
VVDNLAPEADGDPQDLNSLRNELQRLRALLGPSEQDYRQLRLDLLGAIDAARGAQAALGEAEGRAMMLEAEIARLQRSHRWLRREIMARIRGRIRGLGFRARRIAARPRVP